VRAAFEAMLLEPLVAPLEDAFGGYGQIAMRSFGDVLAEQLAR